MTKTLVPEAMAGALARAGAAIASSLALVACSTPVEAPEPAEPTREVRLGSAGVYERLASLADCTALQNEFDTAVANNEKAEPGTERYKLTLGYMTYADHRLQEEGC